MNKLTILGFAAALVLTACGPQTESVELPTEASPYATWVDPFIGTGGHGHTYPGATTPFGMVQLSPDTRLEGWDGCGGYHISDDQVYGFSHTHLQGTGVSDYGDILLMPTVGPLDTADRWNERYRDRFVPGSQQAHAGFYSCELERSGLKVELTATTRVGVHRYTRSANAAVESDTLNLYFDLGHRDELIHYSIYMKDDSTLVGHRLSDNWAEQQHVYFAARFSAPFDFLEQRSELRTVSREADGDLQQELEFVPVFPLAFPGFSGLDTLVVRVAISQVDINGALANLNAEAVHSRFDDYLSEAELAWNEALKPVRVQAEDEAERTIFYTALYHSLTVPHTASDVDGRYRGTDLLAHYGRPDGSLRYTVYSLWDTFRATHPLLTLLEPNRTRDFVRNFIDMHREGGQLPVWELSANYTGCMIGYHSVPVIADAWAKGIDGFDTEAALEAMLATAEADELGKRAYAQLGFIPLENESESVSKTLEYGFDDACIASFARAIGRDSIAEVFERRSLAYRNVYRRSTGFVQPRIGGSWRAGFDPTEVSFEYTEANGWQYNFFVPHDIGGHMDLMGGAAAYAAKLDEMFGASSAMAGRRQSDITGLIGQYAHGNEPSHHMAYLHNYAGRPDRSQALVEQICDELYTAAPDGLSGNEDCGQMSSWYVWSALGLYPVTPGDTIYAFGTPRFQKAQLALPGGAEVIFNAPRPSPGAFYIQSVQHDGQPWLDNWISHRALLEGGTWTFEMGDQPGKFGVDASAWPVSRAATVDFCPAPVIEAPRSYRGDSLQLTIACLDPAAKLFYRVGEAPFQPYTIPFSIHSTQVVEAYGDNGTRSGTVRSRIARIDPRLSIEIPFPYANQYSAGGDHALIDGFRGANTDYRTGDWQGYHGHDAEVMVDLGGNYEVLSVQIGVLQDVKSWIWAPESIELWTGLQPGDLTLRETQTSNLDDLSEEPSVERLTFALPGTEARYVRLVARQHDGGVIPDWHIGAGDTCWVFLDEIEIHTEKIYTEN